VRKTFSRVELRPGDGFEELSKRPTRISITRIDTVTWQERELHPRRLGHPGICNFSLCEQTSFRPAQSQRRTYFVQRNRRATGRETNCERTTSPSNGKMLPTSSVERSVRSIALIPDYFPPPIPPLPLTSRKRCVDFLPIWIQHPV